MLVRPRWTLLNDHLVFAYASCRFQCSFARAHASIGASSSNVSVLALRCCECSQLLSSGGMPYEANCTWGWYRSTLASDHFDKVNFFVSGFCSLVLYTKRPRLEETRVVASLLKYNSDAPARCVRLKRSHSPFDAQIPDSVHFSAVCD